MKKLKFVAMLLALSVMLSCVSKKHRYDRCPTFGMKAKKTESVHARI